MCSQHIFFTFSLEKFHLMIISGINAMHMPHAQSTRLIFISCQIATKENTTQMLRSLYLEPPKGMNMYLL